MNFHRNPKPVFHRRQVPAQARSQTRSRPVPAPTLGWVSAQNEAAMKPGTAVVLDNWFPTQTGIRLFGGSQLHATVSEAGEPCESLMPYIGGATRKLFASTDGNIIEITSPTTTTDEDAAAVSGQTSDYYSSINFSTAGGNYLYAVNGTDDALLYDGTNWDAVNTAALSTLSFDAQTGNFTVGQVVTGTTSGAFGTLERQTDAGTTGTLYLRGISGGPFQNNEAITDPLGGAAVVDGTAATFVGAFTNVDTADLSHVNAYRNRLYFVEVGTLNVWYQATDALTGAASQLSLAGVFKQGGAVLFTATWSLDAGDGLDDKFVVVSTEGEVAVYQGSDPSDSTTWSLVGLYEVAPPLGKNAYMRAGGDLLILTTLGAVPISQAIVKDKAALALAAISKNIAPDWTAEARSRSTVPWEIAKWPSRAMTLITNPVASDSTPAQCMVVNSETGAWCRRTGWDARCVALHNDQVYFGTNAGTVFKADIGGLDNGDTYTCRAAFAWDHVGAPGLEKTVVSARAQFKTSTPVNPQLSVSTDYATSWPHAPAAGDEPSTTSQWDVGLWDVAIWDEAGVTAMVNTRWNSIGASGFVVSAQVQVTCGTTATPSTELVIFEMLSENGEVMT